MKKIRLIFSKIVNLFLDFFSKTDFFPNFFLRTYHSPALQVISGLFQAEETMIVNKDNCAQLLANEATRVFHDRLVDKDDRTVFYTALADILHDYFKVCRITLSQW